MNEKTLLSASSLYFCLLLQFDLVCGRDYLMETSQTLLVIGAVTGGVILSALADQVGRKPMVLSCACALGVTSALTAASRSYVAFAVARYFIGVFYSVSFQHLDHNFFENPTEHKRTQNYFARQCSTGYRMIHVSV